MKKCILLILASVAIMLNPTINFANEQIRVGLSSDFEEAKQEIEQSKAENQKIRELAQLSNDEPMMLFADYLDVVLEATADCLTEENDIKASTCLMDNLNQEASKGNYIAEHALGNAYEQLEERDQAMAWYQKALNNENTPDFYKAEIDEDFSRIEGGSE